MARSDSEFISVHGARQNNLQGIDVRLPLGELIVVTGVSGSGKSSLAFDTIYAEGQRRYVETFSPYARQFLDRMDKPQVDRIEGIPPAIAIDQTNPVKTSRSTVGTMTELNDHLKLLFARTARLDCRECQQPVHRDTATSIASQLVGDRGPLLVTFPVNIPHNFSRREVLELLARQGYTKIHASSKTVLEVVQDRIQPAARRRPRIIEALEAALVHGQGHVRVNGQKFSADLHCANCDIHYQDPVPSLFSFNSPIGACDTCRGFGRTIGIDDDLVIPDDSRTLAGGAVKPWQSESYRECQDDLLRFAKKRAVPTNVPWNKLTDAQRAWVWDGEGSWEDNKWYGIHRFFDWLETKSYRMHVRVLLARYRAYRPCAACHGSRLKPDALLWKLPAPKGGLNIHRVMLLPISESAAYFDALQLPAPLDEASTLLLGEIRTRLRYLVEVGLGYLTLDRQSRTLSGGEVQRINLTTALGTSLVNTLFVLDEPSIGLHPRDIHRLVGVLRRLRDAGNTLLVVEHDPEVILAADRVLDVGPGPGEQGGQVVFQGTVPALLRHPTSRTGQHLAGRERNAFVNAATKTPPAVAAQLAISGAAENNLKGIDVTIPLEQFVCITGVSGSGKSTLVEDILYRGLLRLQRQPTDPPGRHRAIIGHETLSGVVLVDQSPIGKTTRSNPASYVGAFDEIRKLFARQDLAQARSYTAGMFSFNAGDGRCQGCKGNGFEHVEMQFLSDVYLRCPDCNGKRYGPDVLEVTFRQRSIANVLEMTVTEASTFFEGHPAIIRALCPLQEVGLGYVRLGQPVPTLSGGEAQRLKLAAHLGTKTKGQTLFLFDEPTTGLHFDDVVVLMHALRQLLQRGHSVVVIEHNLEVIRQADWIIDLGPEGGSEGGAVVCCGTPAMVATCPKSHTGQALAATPESQPTRPVIRESRRPWPARVRKTIGVHHAREHNLCNLEVTIPRDKFTVVTGISGSGKSTLAFDILFAEGQRRYLESLNAYARQFVQPAARPDVDAIYGIPPTVAIEQRTSRGGRKSTVATVTEVYHFLRLLFVKLGTPHCPSCRLPIKTQSEDAIRAALVKIYRGQTVKLLAPLVIARKGLYKDLAAWAAKRGYDQLRVDGKRLSTKDWPPLNRFKEHTIDLPVGTCRISSAVNPELRQLLQRALDLGKGHVIASAGHGRDPERLFSTRNTCPQCQQSFPELDPRLFSFNSRHGWCPSCFGTGLELYGFDDAQSGEEIWWNDWWDGVERPCGDCQGHRLRPEALAVTFRDETITSLTGRSVGEAARFFGQLRLQGRERAIARDLVAELGSRLRFLQEVGLGYLSLDRAAPTLSGGEAQRIRLAAQLGSNLRGVCYILDEPTIGLHPRDNKMLLRTLRQLEDKGNTVVVVEHDEDTIRQAEHVIDLGPGAGKDGGRLVASGTVAKLIACKESVTGQYLRRKRKHRPRQPLPSRTRDARIQISGATLHNLKRLAVTIPLGRLVCVTGVSGSGKSTLVRDVLYENLQVMVGRKDRKTKPSTLRGCRRISGGEQIKRVLEVDQTPIGKTPRSCPATYVGFWDDIRRLFAQTNEARMRGYTASRFSFNTAEGRCPECEGQGLKKIEMSFLPDVSVTCDTCAGRRFTDETLTVTWKDRTIAEVLAMSIDEAAACFVNQRRIEKGLRLLQEVGLGYLTLGQQSPTLSGGEAQRIKLVTELAKANQTETLYILDEPTIGLHMADVEKLVGVLQRLVAAGNTVVVIEHNLDVIAEADWIIDLGPEGGDNGGQIVAEGSPDDLVRAKTHTGRFLKSLIKNASR